MESEATTVGARFEHDNGWPAGVVRIPEEDWARNTVDESALKYDNHKDNIFGATWDPVIAQVLSVLDDNKIMVDYSCGTGQFTERLLRHFTGAIRILNVDASPRYMRIAVDRFKDDHRVALRLLGKDRDSGKLERFDTVAKELVEEPGVDVLTSTNAIHLYPDLQDTLESWYRVLRPGGLVIFTTGDMINSSGVASNWSLHDAVGTVNDLAREVIEKEPMFKKYRDKIDDSDTLEEYASLRKRVYPSPKPIDLYLKLLSDAGIPAQYHFERTINVSAEDMIDALAPYHDIVLGWVGGSKKVEGYPPTRESVRDRMFLIRYCIEKLYACREYYQFGWKYFTCKKSLIG